MKIKVLICSIITAQIVVSCGVARIQPSSQVKQMSDELAITPYYDEQDRDYILGFALNAADSSYVIDAWADNQKFEKCCRRQQLQKEHRASDALFVAPSRIELLSKV